ncbi:DUF669 domain-containing protein [Bosea sp. FBZP-16]|uniref:DUF669 domain-containing protein n=1 Tax=Bosea sp. FBZP-16 TaxID=2065382 RepID=UPI001319F9A3|nr:DUF669 domain-containing protein [Bosea sp. FBZP-16]
MASIGGSYNPDAEPSSGYQPLPAGEYALEIVESDYDVNARGNGMVLKCKAQIVGGAYDCRPFYINYNLEHEDDQTQEIGQRDFAGLRRATGVLSPSDTSELHFKTFRVKIGRKVRKSTGELENVIKQYLFGDEPDPEPHRPGVKAAEWRKAA